MAAATAWAVYDLAMLKIGNKQIDLDSDTIKCALFASTSNVGSNSLATCTYAIATNELATANGYTSGGATVSPTWANSSGTITWDVADATWTPTGSGINARYAVLYDSTSGDLICWSLLDSTPADVNVQSITIDAAGVFTMARA